MSRSNDCTLAHRVPSRGLVDLIPNFARLDTPPTAADDRASISQSAARSAVVKRLYLDPHGAEEESGGSSSLSQGTPGLPCYSRWRVEKHEERVVYKMGTDAPKQGVVQVPTNQGCIQIQTRLCETVFSDRCMGSIVFL